jgi:hypothetical protein
LFCVEPITLSAGNASEIIHTPSPFFTAQRLQADCLSTNTAHWSRIDWKNIVPHDRSLVERVPKIHFPPHQRLQINSTLMFVNCLYISIVPGSTMVRISSVPRWTIRVQFPAGESLCFFHSTTQRTPGRVNHPHFIGVVTRSGGARFPLLVPSSSTWLNTADCSV